MVIGALASHALVVPRTAGAKQPLDDALRLGMAEPSGQTVAQGAAKGSEAPRRLQVTVAPAVADADLLPRWIAERHTDVGWQLAVADHEQSIWVDVAGAGYEYRITVTPQRDGKTVGPPPAAIECACASEELLARVDEQIGIALQVLREVPIEEPPVDFVEPAEPPRQPESEPAIGLERDGLTRLGIAGVVTLSVGLAMVVSGGVLMGVGERPLRDEASDIMNRDYRPPGFAAISVGLSAAVAGAAMLALDLTRCRRGSSRRCREVEGLAERSALTPQVRLSGPPSSSSIGLSLRGRF